MKTKIISSENDKIGVVLYNCELTENVCDVKNVVVL